MNGEIGFLVFWKAKRRELPPEAEEGWEPGYHVITSHAVIGALQ